MASFRTSLKITVNTSICISGLMNDQRKPRADRLYLTLRSRDTSTSSSSR